MEYKSKYTASEIDAKLSQVFDSTLQTKEVEVSEDTTIKADEGFLALKEVSVKVKGGSGSGSDWRYYASDTAILRDVIGLIAHKVKYTTGNVGMSASYFSASSVDSQVFAIAYDALTLIKGSDGVSTFQEELIKAGFSEEAMSQLGLRKITEEEFYA